MALKKVATRLDEDVIEAVERYSYAAKHANVAQTYRELIADGLCHRTERAYASPVRQQVKEELDAFVASIELRLSMQALDVLSGLDADLCDRIDAAERAALASLVLASEAASRDGGERAEEALARALAKAYSLADPSCPDLDAG